MMAPSKPPASPPIAASEKGIGRRRDRPDTGDNAGVGAADAMRAGLAHHHAGRLAEAERDYRRVLAADPGNAEALHLSGLLAYQLGRHQLAIELIARAIERNGDTPAYFSSYGLALQRAGRVEEAIGSFDRALALRPNDVATLVNRGLALQGRGDLGRALDSYNQAVSADAHCVEALVNRGNVLQLLGRLPQAIDSYDEALALRPGLVEAQFNRAHALNDLGCRDEARAAYERVLVLDPGLPETLLRTAIGLRAAGQSEEALAGLDQVLMLQPHCAEAWFHRGLAAHDLARFTDALECYERALSVRPDYIAVLIGRGDTLVALRRFAEALESYDRAFALRPDDLLVLNNRGLILLKLGRPTAALESFDRALALSAQDVDVLVNRGVALYELGRVEEALETDERALALRPAVAEAWHNRGLVLRQLRQFDDALASFDRALALRPDFPQCAFDRACLLLLLGRFPEGWEAYESRRRKDNWSARPPAGPEWCKDRPPGNRILLYAEQGLGDTIQFCRFAGIVAAGGATVVLQVPRRLAALLTGLPGVEIIPEGSPLPPYDTHLPVMSLPYVLGMTPQDLTVPVPYLFADPARVALWAKRLPQGSFRVGIAWQGNSLAEVDRGRSIPLHFFARLSAVFGVTLISLQKDNGAEQLTTLPPGSRVEVLGRDFDAGPDAFRDTAAVVMNLDLVICSDTAVAHLAAALGRPVWVVLKQVPDWRWLLEREDSPWYPTVRLFRQSVRDDWDEVFDRVAAALAQAASLKQQSGHRFPPTKPVGTTSKITSNNGEVLIPVAFGELVDKITILEIKQERIAEPAKLARVRQELAMLVDVLARLPAIPDQSWRLKSQLRAVNETLWDIENQIRDCEREHQFGAGFIQLARAVYRNNDRRAAIKRELSELAHSSIVEQKSYHR